MALIEQKAAVSAISDLLMYQLKGERLPTWNEVYHAIHNLTPVDAVPVVHGHWRIGDRTNVYGGREIICSQCGESFMVSPKTLEYLSDCERFCCRCGAKMDGKDEA